MQFLAIVQRWKELCPIPRDQLSMFANFIRIQNVLFRETDEFFHIIYPLEVLINFTNIFAYGKSSCDEKR